MTPPPPSSLAPSTGESHCLAHRPLSLRCILLLFPEPLFVFLCLGFSVSGHHSPAMGLAPGSVPLVPSSQQSVLTSVVLCSWGCRMGP